MSQVPEEMTDLEEAIKMFDDAIEDDGMEEEEETIEASDEDTPEDAGLDDTPQEEDLEEPEESRPPAQATGAGADLSDEWQAVVDRYPEDMREQLLRDLQNIDRRAQGRHGGQIGTLQQQINALTAQLNAQTQAQISQQQQRNSQEEEVADENGLTPSDYRNLDNVFGRLPVVQQLRQYTETQERSTDQSWLDANLDKLETGEFYGPDFKPYRGAVRSLLSQHVRGLRMQGQNYALPQEVAEALQGIYQSMEQVRQGKVQQTAQKAQQRKEQTRNRVRAQDNGAVADGDLYANLTEMDVVNKETGEYDPVRSFDNYMKELDRNG